MKNSKQQIEEPPSTGSPQNNKTEATKVKSSALVRIETRTPILQRVRSRIARIFSFRAEQSIEQEIAELIEEHDPEGTQVGTEERSIVNNVLSLSESTVSDVMVPRTDIIAVEVDAPLSVLKKTIIDKGHTRTPIYKDSLDNVIGFVHIKDLLPYLGSKSKFNTSKIIREILYIPPSMKVMDLLVKMRDKRVHMALVLDEYGGTDGLVTMEDLMEEIVGEIEDEHDTIEDAGIKKNSDGNFEVSARFLVSDLEKKLRTKLTSIEDSEDFDTVGGLLFFLLGRIPKIGDTVTHKSGYIFEILDADARKIKKILIKK